MGRTETAWDGVANQERAYTTYNKAHIKVAIEKLARGLTWILGHEPQPLGSEYAWDMRVGTPFEFEGPFNVTEFEFGDRFRCSV